MLHLILETAQYQAEVTDVMNQPSKHSTAKNVLSAIILGKQSDQNNQAKPCQYSNVKLTDDECIDRVKQLKALRTKYNKLVADRKAQDEEAKRMAGTSLEDKIYQQKIYEKKEIDAVLQETPHVQPPKIINPLDAGRDQRGPCDAPVGLALPGDCQWRLNEIAAIKDKYEPQISVLTKQFNQECAKDSHYSATCPPPSALETAIAISNAINAMNTQSLAINLTGKGQTASGAPFDASKPMTVDAKCAFYSYAYTTGALAKIAGVQLAPLINTLQSGNILPQYKKEAVDWLTSGSEAYITASPSERNDVAYRVQGDARNDSYGACITGKTPFSTRIKTVDAKTVFDSFITAR